MSQSEIDQKHMKPSAILIDAIVKPMEITIKDPAIAFVNTYTAIIYGIYYSFFEVFPLVYPVSIRIGFRAPCRGKRREYADNFLSHTTASPSA